MKLNLRTRPWIYLAFGPLIGLIFVIISLTILEDSAEMTLPTVPISDWLWGFYAMIMIAYFAGSIPALLTGLITSLTLKLLRNYSNNIFLSYALSAFVGFTITTWLLILFALYTNEWDGFDTYILLYGTCGLIAAIICESLHSKISKQKY